jgi:hypothetical protein
MNIRRLNVTLVALRSGLLYGLLLSCPALTLKAEPPQATLLEVHSCEVYAGGCVVSSQATLEGRYLIRGWKFSGGEFNGVDFTGLNLAVIQASAENLAAAEAPHAQGVVYLPHGASAAQEQALLAWLKAGPDFQNTELQTRVVNLDFHGDGQNYRLRAGGFLSVATGPLESCEAQACGEALWYTPRVEGSVFAVVLNKASSVDEPLLKLKWQESGKRSAFLAKIGKLSLQRNVYVSASELCAPGNKLF